MPTSKFGSIDWKKSMMAAKVLESIGVDISTEAIAGNLARAAAGRDSKGGSYKCENDTR